MHPDLQSCYWFDSLPTRPRPRAVLEDSIRADIAIVGAGYTGLWTAYHLKRLDPGLDIVILEAEHVGFGAAGRNGGWLMGTVEGLDAYLAGCDSETREIAHREVHDIVRSAGEDIRREGIDCDFAHGGCLYAAARYPEQLRVAEAYLAGLRAAGHTESDYRWLDQAQLEQRVRVAGGRGAIYTPHVAAIQPAKLALGLADVVERLGVRIFEQSLVTDWQAGRLRTDRGRVEARIVIPALEGYSNQLTKLRRYVLPFQSGMVVTEPLSEETWAAIGLAERTVLCDYSRLATYLQRTADDRLAFGARGSYRYGGKPVSQFDPADQSFAARRALARDFFPVLDEAQFTHAWGGTLGIPRRFAPHVVYDEAGGFATAGGYVGEGVGASHLFGRTLAELILSRETDRTRLPWVFRRRIDKALRRWEPEPLRWLGYRAVFLLYGWEENQYRSPTAPQWRKNLAWFAAEKFGKLLG